MPNITTNHAITRTNIFHVFNVINVYSYINNDNEAVLYVCCTSSETVRGEFVKKREFGNQLRPL